VSYETKLTSGNEADRNQSAMREVKVKTATEREKLLALPPKANFCELAANPCYEAETICESMSGVLAVSCIFRGFHCESTGDCSARRGSTRKFVLLASVAIINRVAGQRRGLGWLLREEDHPFFTS
jgi:hypothetical protein